LRAIRGSHVATGNGN